MDMKASAKKIAFILIPHFLAEGEEIRLIIKKEGHLHTNGNPVCHPFQKAGKSMPEVAREEGDYPPRVGLFTLVKNKKLLSISVNRVKNTPFTQETEREPSSDSEDGGRGAKSTPLLITTGKSIKGTGSVTSTEVATIVSFSRVPFMSARGIAIVTNTEESAKSIPILPIPKKSVKGISLQPIPNIKDKNDDPCCPQTDMANYLTSTVLCAKVEPPVTRPEASASIPKATSSRAKTKGPEVGALTTRKEQLAVKSEGSLTRVELSSSGAEVLAAKIEASPVSGDEPSALNARVKAPSTPSAGPERLSPRTASGTRVKAFDSKAKDLSFVTPSDTELETAECSIRRIPLVIASGITPKSVVVDYSGELEHTSIKRGQYLKDIVSLIEGAKIIPVDNEYVEELNRKVTGYLKNFSPTVENPYPGSYYIDLTGTRRLFGKEIDTCGRIILGLKAMGFTARCGVGSTTLVARLASEVAGDCAVYEVFEPSESLFITPLSITLLPDLPLPVQKELREDYNIKKIGELLGFSKNDLRYLFGKTGELLYEYSRGWARNTLNEKKTEEALKWECVINSEGNDNRVLRRRFFDMLVEVCTTLRREQRVPKRAELTVVYRDNYHYITGGKLSHPSFFEEELYRELVFYLNRALQRRTSVKKFILCLSRFTHPSLQLELFEDALKATELSRACDLIRERYGSGSIAYGV